MQHVKQWHKEHYSQVAMLWGDDCDMSEFADEADQQGVEAGGIAGVANGAAPGGEQR